MFEKEPLLLQELHKPLPRYTSYPTAVDWTSLTEVPYIQALKKSKNPLSLYIHIPFCKSMCLYCGCSVVLNRKKENEERYVAYLLEEIALVASYFLEKKRVVQLHFGGGTPTQLTIPLLTQILEKLTFHFDLDFSQEIAIEVDPRTIYEDGGAKLRQLKELGFNRISLGVQDSDEKVQEAVKRRQSWQMTQETFFLAKELGFQTINVDLIYGLPLQTEKSFAETTEQIINLRPDRIALFSYAKIPWLKKHQKAIRETDLPSTESKFAIYAAARERFMQEGYQAIGMDHFALASDELTIAYREKRLMRNFQGYSVQAAEESIGLGFSAISYVGNGYFQNSKELSQYYTLLEQKTLPIQKGFLLSEEDLTHKEAIQKLMCHFELPKSKALLPYLTSISKELNLFEEKGLLKQRADKIVVTPMGELFIRNIASLFDLYRTEPLTHFSQSI